MSTTTPSYRRVSGALPVGMARSAQPSQAVRTDRHPETLSPPPARTAGPCPRREWLAPSTRVLARGVGLIVLLGSALALTAVAPLPASAAQPAPCPPGSPPVECPPVTPLLSTALPVPAGPPTSVGCLPGSPQPECPSPGGTTAPGGPCPGLGCLPPPPPPIPPGGGQAGQGSANEAECGISALGGCVTNAITAFFRDLVTTALNPLLDLLSTTLLTTPTPQSLPRIGELWTHSWQILLASYVLLILIAGILVMTYETLQTQHSVKEIAPRIVVGFLAGALSLWAASQAIDLANALAQAIMGSGLDATSAGQTLRNLVLGPLNGGIFIILVGLFVAGMLLVLLLTYIVRVALTIVLIAGAPLALMFHALPQTEPIAYWWWKAFGGCLAIQVVQSLALITTLKVFLAPGGFTLFGPTTSGLVNLLVALALFSILTKIPFWVLGSLRVSSGRRSTVGTIARAYLVGTALGWINPRHHAPSTGQRPSPQGGPSGRGGGPWGRGPSSGGPRGGGGPSGPHPSGGSGGRGPSGGAGRGRSGGGGRDPSRGRPSGGGHGPGHRGQASPSGQLWPQPMSNRAVRPAVPGRSVPRTGIPGFGDRGVPTARSGLQLASSRQPGVHPAVPTPAAPLTPGRVPPRRLPVDLPAARRGPTPRPVPTRARSRSGGLW
jgi:hypothetical protein